MSSTRIGTTVAGYRLEALLGRGGMSVVYLATHERLGRKVALKLLAPALSHDEGFRERFETESRRAAEIDHPNIVPVYDAGEADGQLYIAMRYVKGYDLKTLLERDGALPVGRALFLLEQTAAGLDAAHDRDLVHRDVKPANVLIEEGTDHVFVTDFGVVKHTTSSRGLTRTGIFIGTVEYASPEQIEGLAIDARTDVYALGCMLYECLTGRAPFTREGEVAVMHAHLTEPPPLVTDVRPELPKSVNAVVAAAMAKDRELRYPSCGELIGAARAAVLQQPVTSTGTAAAPAGAPAAPPGPAAELAPAIDAGAAAPGPPPGPAGAAGGPPRRMWLAIAAAAIVAVAGAAVAVVFATRGDSSPKQTTVTVAQQPTEQATTQAGTAPETTATTAPGADTTATTAPVATAADPANVETLVPGPLWKSCELQTVPDPGAVQTAVCLPPATPDGLYHPARWQVSTYADAASLDAAYEALVREDSQKLPGTGQCNGTTWNGGDTPWQHADGGRGGRRFCFGEGGQVVVVWTHEKLGQDTHADVIGIARAPAGDHPQLFNWWNFWHHRVGKLQS